MFNDIETGHRPNSTSNCTAVVNRHTALDLPTHSTLDVVDRTHQSDFTELSMPTSRTHGVAERALDHGEDGLRQRSLAVESFLCSYSWLEAVLEESVAKRAQHHFGTQTSGTFSQAHRMSGFSTTDQILRGQVSRTSWMRRYDRTLSPSSTSSNRSTGSN